MLRQSNVAAAIVLVAALATAASASAQARLGAPVKPVLPQLAPGLSSKPYSRLFDQQLAQARTALRFQMKSITPNSAIAPNSARRFICGMPVLPSDPSIDPKFEVRPPDTTTRFSMRVVPPSSCH